MKEMLRTLRSQTIKLKDSMGQKLSVAARRFPSGRSDHGGQDGSLGEPGLFRNILRPKKLESLFLFVTSKCNSKCKTCFYAEHLNDGRDMSLEQILELSRTAPKFDKLWLSGGEPILRKDLAEIVEAFVSNNGVKAVNFPTNGLLYGPLEKTVSRLLETCPDLTIHLNFSLDGMPKGHDEVRGIPGAFQRTVTNMKRIEERFAGNPRLLVNVATVITPQAYHEIMDLGRYLLEEHDIAVQFFETVRGDPKDPATKTLTTEQLQAIHKQLIPLHGKMADRLFADLPRPARAMARASFLGVLRFAYDIHEQNLEHPTPWPMTCTAGTTTIVVDHDGHFRSCELRPPIGHLSEYDYDITAALRSRAMQEEIEAIGGGQRANCWCTHTCWILSSLKFSPKAMLTDVPKSFVKALFQDHSLTDKSTEQLLTEYPDLRKVHAAQSGPDPADQAEALP